MNKLFGVKLTRFILIAFSATMAGIAILDIQAGNYSGALISIGVSLMLFIDALNPLFFTQSLSFKKSPVSNKVPTESAVEAPTGYQMYALKLAWTLILVGIAAKLYVVLF